MQIVPDEDAEIDPVPTSVGRKPEPELDRLNNILKTFSSQVTLPPRLPVSAFLFQDFRRLPSPSCPG
jgi:hypothetical protein